MLDNLLNRKRHVLKAIEQARAKVKDLETERAQAKGRLWEAEQERDRLTRTIFDEKAKVFLAADRAPIEVEIERLTARRPQVEAEIAELTEEIIPRLQRHLQEAEQAVKAEALNLRYEATARAAEGRDGLLRQWNVSTADLLRVAEAIGKHNGQFDFHRRGYSCAAVELRQPMHAAGEGIPASLLHALHVALGEAWTRGYAAGEKEANAEQIRL